VWQVLNSGATSWTLRSKKERFNSLPGRGGDFEVGASSALPYAVALASAGFVLAVTVGLVLGTAFVPWEVRESFQRIAFEFGYAQPTTVDIVLGVAMLLAVFTAARRAIGWAFPIIAGVLFAYGLWGHHAPDA
jgi:hypothetical protein